MKDSDINEVSEMWRDLHAIRQEKRAKNRVNSADLLKEKGVAFSSHNGGAHLIIATDDVRADFWPGTGKFIFHRPKMFDGRGVFKLVQSLETQGYKFLPPTRTHQRSLT